MTDVEIDQYIGPIIEQISVLRESARVGALADPNGAGRVGTTLIETAQGLLNAIDVVLRPTDRRREMIHDQVALRAMSCFNICGNEDGDILEWLASLRRCLTVAAGQEARARIDKNLDAVIRRSKEESRTRESTTRNSPNPSEKHFSSTEHVRPERDRGRSPGLNLLGAIRRSLSPGRRVFAISIVVAAALLSIAFLKVLRNPKSERQPTAGQRDDPKVSRGLATIPSPFAKPSIASLPKPSPKEETPSSTASDPPIKAPAISEAVPPQMPMATPPQMPMAESSPDQIGRQIEEIEPVNPNSLPVGSAPFGKGITGGHSTIAAENGTDTDALVHVIRIEPHEERVRNFYVPSTQNFVARSIPTGRYVLRVAYGKDWNDSERRFNFRRSFEETDPFDITETTYSDPADDRGYVEHYHYSEISITLHKVENGNLKSHPISEGRFWR